MTNPLINAYKAAQNLGLDQQGLDARAETPIPQSFQKALDSLSGETSSTQVGAVSANMLTSTLNLMKDAEHKGKLAAEGKADPLEVSHAMNNVNMAAEQLTTAISKAVAAYQSVTNMQL